MTKAPDFKLKDQDGKEHSLSQYLGRKIILYFYPQDQTPGCTIEAQNFRDAKTELDKLDIVLLGVSPDDEKSHKKFCEKEALNFTLLADPEKEVIKKYGLWVEKLVFGKNVMGVKRDTFLINEEGYIIKHFSDVKPEEHIEEILNSI